MGADLGDRLPVRTSEDIVVARQVARRHAVAVGFTLVDQTRLITAVSELARNMVEHGGGGVMTARLVRNQERLGLQVVFEDEGPGIADIGQAMTDGYASRNGLGLGLGAAKRLSDEFEIASEVGSGTRIAITRWRRASL